jgi:heat shock protein HtpX
MNYLKTGILMVCLAVILIWIGSLIGGARGAVIAFLFALIINGVSYWFSDKIVLKMYKAQEVSRQDNPDLYGMVEELSKNAGLPMPKVCIADISAPNAFATGRNPEHAALCATKGLIDLLDKEELRGVLSHELGHVANRDTLIMTVTAAMASAIMMLAYMARWAAIFGGFEKGGRRDSGNLIGLIAISIIGPLAAMMVQLAVSRSREYAADKAGAQIAKNPLGLARALEDMSSVAGKYKFSPQPQTAHLFIFPPLKGSFVANLFSTHPPTEERIKRLRGMI